MSIDPTTPPLTDADLAALDATSPIGPEASAPASLKHRLEACASRTRTYIAQQPVRATLLAAAGGAALMICLKQALGASRRVK